MKCGAFSKSFIIYFWNYECQSGVYFFDFFLGELCYSLCPWHITRIDDLTEQKRNSSDFWRAGIFVF